MTESARLPHNPEAPKFNPTTTSSDLQDGYVNVATTYTARYEEMTTGSDNDDASDNSPSDSESDVSSVTSPEYGYEEDITYASDIDDISEECSLDETNVTPQDLDHDLEMNRDQDCYSGMVVSLTTFNTRRFLGSINLSSTTLRKMFQLLIVTRIYYKLGIPLLTGYFSEISSSHRPPFHQYLQIFPPFRGYYLKTTIKHELQALSTYTKEPTENVSTTHDTYKKESER
jgi:hypothetical protein